MSKGSTMNSFEAEFADPTEWASMYRGLGLQVVPAMKPSENKTQYKRPALPKWRELEHQLAPDFTFERWYGENGEHARRYNMGMIAGACSDGAFIIDLDLHKNPQAQAWWDEMTHMATGAGDLDTVEQVTGGGGVQLLFRAPAGWTPPTCKTSIGVDIRGQGGFAMLPPSMHESGTPYRWKPGREPWNMEIAEAPRWLCEQISSLAHEHGGSAPSGSGPAQRTSTPAHATDSFGRMIDGREDYMTKMVWARVVDEYRQCPIAPGATEIDTMLRDTFATYERAVKSRIREPGTPNHILLEREGRGITLLKQKLKTAIDQWEDKVREHAAVPRVERPKFTPENKSPSSRINRRAFNPLETNEEFEQNSPENAPEHNDGEFPEDPSLFELLSVTDIKTLPDPQMLVEGFIIDQGLGFIFGVPGGGKSFVAQDLALSIACGFKKWWGREIHKSGPVIYISSEGVGDFKFRIRAWEEHHGVSADTAPFYLIRQSINFMAEPDVDRLLRTIHQLCKKMGELPALVVVDTVSRVLPGADENLQKDMTLFIRACDEVRQNFAATVIGVHHTSRNGNLRGSTVFDGAGDFLALIEKEEGEMSGVMTAKKIKSAQDGWKQYFDLKEVTVDRKIKEIKSLVAVAVTEDRQTNNEKSGWPPKHVCNQVLDEIRKAWNEGAPWSSKPQTRVVGRYAPALMKARFDIPEKTAASMIQAWLENSEKVLTDMVCDSSTKMKGLKVTGTIN